ncbi:MAG TPA: ABC transporter permease [Terriglobales bacterium]|nr:ABC transporter permease [Terriglobales bacterium]
MKLYTIVKREFLTRVRTRGFVIFTLLLPVLAAGFLFFEFKMVQASRTTSSTVAVVDMSGEVYSALEQVGAAGSSAQFSLHPVVATPATLTATERDLRQQVLDGAEDGYLIIPADVLASRQASYYLRNPTASGASALEGRLRQAVNRAQLEAAGVLPAQLAALQGDFTLHRVRVSTAGNRADTGGTGTVAIALSMVLYVFLIMYGVVVMKSVTEEKTSRISEVLLAAVDPFSLMLGKILGVVATALAQLAIWSICLALASGYALAMAQAAGSDLLQRIPHIPLGLLAAFLVFFLLGFLLYASLYAAIGAMVSNDQEAQQTQVPLTFLLVAAIFLAFKVMAAPSTLASVILSLIPFFAPVLMVMRIAVATPPLWQVLLSMALCLATFLLLTKITAKIYRVGILMTGKRPNLPELLRWLKYA